MVAVELVRGLIITYLTTWVFPPLKEKIKVQINSLLIQKFKHVDFINLEIPDYYNKLELSFSESEDGFLNLVDSFFFMLNSLFYIASLVTVIATLDVFLVVIAITTSCVMLFTQLICAKINYKYEDSLAKEERAQRYWKNVFCEGTVFKDIKIFDCHSLFFGQYLKASESKKRLVKDRSTKIGMINLLSSILKVVLLLAGSMFYIVYKIGIGTMEIGGFVALYTATMQCTNQLIDFVITSAQLYQDGLYVNNFRTIYEKEPQIEIEGGHTYSFSKNIRVDNLSFSYDGADNPALKNISMEINKGETIAVVGANGAGKTTLVKLLLRLYDPDSGSISIDNTDIKCMDISTLRKNISYLPQEIDVYATSIAENVLMRSCETAEDEAHVIDVLKIVGLEEKVKELPNGIYTVMSKEYEDGGTNFSGGEIQKLALARALVKPAEIIIMDEPSSAMDPLSTDQFLKNMVVLMKNKTVIVITHQLSLTQMADRIYCFDKGQLLEVGNHEELFESNGMYREMYEAQSSWFV
ncbi:MAG: ABC transporter ATP-binding protein [Bariatricus sp.]